MPNLPSGHPVLLRRRSGAARQPVVLLACGSFNPPTIAHLRMFELAADTLREVRKIQALHVKPETDIFSKFEELMPVLCVCPCCLRMSADAASPQA